MPEGTEAGTPQAPPRVCLAIGSRVVIAPPALAPVEVRGKSAAVLAMAALDGPVTRRWLAAALWPGSPEGQARNNLRTLVHRLNRRAGRDILVGADTVGIDRDAVRVVRESLEDLLAHLGERGTDRIGLLAEAGIDGESSAPLVDWLEAARQRQLRGRLARLCEGVDAALSRVPRDRRQVDRAVALARACVQLEPTSERWHRQLMETLFQCGDRGAALVAYEECKARLMEQLGVQPEWKTRQTHLRVLRGELAPEPAHPDQAESLASPRDEASLPLVERESALDALRRALADGLHVAVQGEAGVGKTRLLRAAFPGSDVEQLSFRSGGRDEPYAALGQLLHEVQRRRAARVATPEQIELARLAPLAFPDVRPSEGGLSVARLHSALLHWAGRLRDEGVRLLVLDDVHEADAASQAALAILVAAERDGQPAFPLLLAHRSAELAPGLAQAITDAQAAGRARCLVLPRLGLAGVGALVRAMGGGHLARDPDRLASALLERTGGNPLFVIQLARHALDRPDGDIGSSASLDALLRLRLEGCGVVARQLACVAAVAAEDFSVELAAAVMATPLLDLLQPWTELQQRGLFADHGLAHDLVRDAVLGGLPGSIARVLHRQVAGHLEGLGLRGPRVLQHWMQAGDFDRALPHLIDQRHATSAAGLSTRQHDLVLMDVLEGLSDRALLANLWVSAELRGHPQPDPSPPEVWPRMTRLVERVRRLGQRARTQAWEAFERSRVLFFHERRVRDAYVLLADAVAGLPSPSLERARAELTLALFGFALHGAPREHVQRAKDALSGLPEGLGDPRLRIGIETMSGVFIDPCEAIAASAGRMRHARRRGDLGGAAEARSRIAEIHLMLGNHQRAHRHFAQLRPWRPGADVAFEYNTSRMLLGVAAMNAGRYAEALWHFDNAKDGGQEVDVYLAMLHARLGRWERAAAVLARATDPSVFNLQAPTFHFAAVIRASLDEREGRDPLPALRHAVATLEAQGIAGSKRDLMAWEVLRRTAPAEVRIESGEGLVRSLRSQSLSRRWLPVLLDVAEAHAAIGGASARALAREAAHELRRGYTAIPVHQPDCLLRCARLLRPTDRRESGSLEHLARRWVVQALEQVPDDARASFVDEVPVNRWLLRESPCLDPADRDGDH